MSIPEQNIAADPNELTRKEKRAYQRMLTGLSVGSERDAYIRFMTLTSAPDSPKDINYSFKMLKNRIARATPEQIKRINKKYGISLPTFHGFKFNRYFKLKTAEGHNVLHIVYWGLKSHFIPQEWLKWNWDQIHGAFKADIRIVWRRHRTKTARIKGLVGYLLTNYLCKQPILRMSYGWKWAWLGFCKSWKHVKSFGVGWIRVNATADKRQTYEISDRLSFEKKFRQWVPFKYRYRNIALELWDSLTKNPLPSLRTVKLVNPDYTKYTEFGKYEPENPKASYFHWVPGNKSYVNIKASPNLSSMETVQHHLCDKLRLKCNRFFGFPEDWCMNPLKSCWNGFWALVDEELGVDVPELENEFGYSEAHRFAMV